MSDEFYTIDVERADGSSQSMNDFRGKLLLIVNTASKCGFTPQYKELQQLYTQYRDQGLEILAFPCNQFLSQEPGSQSDISEFCELNFGVTFPLMKKIDVNGPETSPLFAHLKSEAPGIFGTQKIKWNFTKFLVNQDASLIERYGPRVKPLDIEQKIKKLVNP